MTTFSASAAREDFARILELVTVGNVPVGITRYGDMVARVVPDNSRREDNWEGLAAKYAGMWAGSKWADRVGKPARKFLRRNAAL